MMKSYLPSYFDSLKLLYRLRSDPELINKVQYNQIPFYFRGIDEGALREVWEENEYLEKSVGMAYRRLGDILCWA